MEQFAAKNVPLSVAVIDMDWHLTDVPYGQRMDGLHLGTGSCSPTRPVSCGRCTTGACM